MPRRVDRRYHRDRQTAQAVDAARNLSISGPVGFTTGAHGSEFDKRPDTHLRLFEITETWAQETRAKPWPTGSWYAIAKQVIYYPDNLSSSGDWMIDVNAPEFAIWSPDDVAPSSDVGDIVWATFNKQSGFWEILCLEGDVLWWFELAQNLPIYNPAPVAAYRRLWVPSANSGYGGYETDTDTVFLVADWTEIGYCGYGPSGNPYSPYHDGGAYGVARLHQSVKGIVGVIVDMECPPTCKCLCEEEQQGTSSSSSGV